MSTLAIALCMASWLAQGPGHPMAPSPAVTAPTVTVQMVAIEATRENTKTLVSPSSSPNGMGFHQGDEGPGTSLSTPESAPRLDPELKALEEVLPTRQYNRFQLIRSQESSTPYGQEEKLSIDSRYALYVTPLGKDERAGIRIQARIEETRRVAVVQPEQKSLTGNPARKAVMEKRDAINTTSTVPAGRRLSLCGPKLDKGDLVVVISVEESPQHPATRHPLH